MKDLTSQDTQQLIGKIKSFLGITWNDIDTEVEINDFILSSIRFIDETAGVELDYLITPATESTDKLFNTMSYIGQELLKNRVFYFREKALDDFKNNYGGELRVLFLDGKFIEVETMLNNNKTYRNDNLRDVQKVFNDGVCEIYSASERVLGTLKGKFYFAKESVGIAHFYQAYNNNISIDRAISIPYNNITVDTQDVVKLDGIWYKIARIQYKDNKKPKHWVLSLQKENFGYEVSNANS